MSRYIKTPAIIIFSSHRLVSEKQNRKVSKCKTLPVYCHQNLPQYRVSGLVLMLRGSQTQKLKFKEELRSLDSIHQAPRRLQGCLWNRLEEQVYNIGILLTVTLITLILIMDDLYIFYSKMAAVKSLKTTRRRRVHLKGDCFTRSQPPSLPISDTLDIASSD